MFPKRDIRTWQRFAKYVRRNQPDLIGGLPKFRNSILVAGCQRSGATILTNIILQHPEIFDYRREGDSELEGALILADHMPLANMDKRFCLQTTYLNENYPEYYNYPGVFKLIFIVRNPYSVVYSMCYHWKRKTQLTNFALNELFKACGAELLGVREKKKFNLFGNIAISSLKKACFSYVAKTSQIFDIKEKLRNAVTIIDYDDLVSRKDLVLPYLFDFIELSYSSQYADLIHAKGIKRAGKLKKNEKIVIQQTCWSTYEKARRLAVNF